MKESNKNFFVDCLDKHRYRNKRERYSLVYEYFDNTAKTIFSRRCPLEGVKQPTPLSALNNTIAMSSQPFEIRLCYRSIGRELRLQAASTSLLIYF